MKIIYEAYDGERFDTKEECQIHEAKAKDREEAIAVLEKLKGICDKSPNCRHCAFNYYGACFFEGGHTPCTYDISEFKKRTER